MFFRRSVWVSGTLLAVAAVFALVGIGCGKLGAERVERLAIPPFENLSDGTSEAWVGWALSEVVGAEVAGSTRLHPVQTRSARDVAGSTATSVLRGYYVVTGDRLRVRASREELKTGRTTGQFSLDERFPDGLARACDALARWVSPDAHRFDTQNLAPLRALAEGRAASDPASAAAAFERSAASDPDFGGAYVAWAQALLMRGDRAGVESVLAKAAAGANRFTESRRVDLEMISSALTRDPERRRRALVSLSRLTPADVEVFRQLARDDAANHRYDSAAESYRKVVSLDPTDVAGWNQLGYLDAVRKNLPAAKAALLEFQKLQPDDANPLDSLGDVHFHLGAFGEAEKYYLQAYEKNKAFLGGAELYKAARARLMTGDVAGADALFQQYSQDRGGPRDPLALYRQAQWLYLTGRREPARVRMEKIASAPAAGEIASLAAAGLALWDLETDGGAVAAAWAAKAVATAASPVTQRLAALCLIASGSQAPSGVLPPDGEKRAAAVRLLVTRRFREAVPLLKEIGARMDPLNSERVDVLLAWALVENGSPVEAAPWLESYGLPPAGIEDPLTFLSIPRVFKLKAAVLAAQGRTREAGEMQAIYRKLGGR